MRFGILGPLQVLDDDGRELSLGGPKQRAVLAILLLHARQVVAGDRLIDELWGDNAPTTAAKTVQVYVSNLRKVLGDGVLLTRAGGYTVQVQPGGTDAERFHELAARGHEELSAGKAKAAAGTLRSALGLWRGQALADFAYEQFAQIELARLEQARLAALEDRIEADLDVGGHALLAGELEALVREHPLRERLRVQLMLALYRAGRHPDALAAYRDAAAALDEIGLQPGPELRHIEEEILRHDPSLSAYERGEDGDMTRAGSGPSGPAAKAADESPGRVADRHIEPARRKVITALFCDIVGSTRLGEELDPEALHWVMNRYWRDVRSIIERHGGTVEKFMGDAVMAAFGIPQVREDDALRAVRAAAEIRDQLPVIAQDAGVGLSFRTAVNTGAVLVAEGENLAIGDAVNVAARLEMAAEPGEILIGEDTFHLVRDAVDVDELEPLALKGKSAPVRAFRLVAVDPHAPGVHRSFETPLVGRERELGLLRTAWQRTLDESGCHLLTVLGVAGVGKSRLVAELLASIGEDALVLSGRCLQYGEGITFWPLIEALTPLGEPARAVLDRVRTSDTLIPEELFWDMRRLFESLAAERPVIVHVDDLQWAQPMLFELLDHVADLSRSAPVLLLSVARPELLDVRPGWGGGKLNATTLLIEPLARAEAERLLGELDDNLADETRERIVNAADGNPLFLEEIVTLTRERHSVTIPSTIHALLAARIEQLPAVERDLLERGAVEGEVFHRDTVAALGADGLDGLDGRLASLVRKQLIRPHPAVLPRKDAFRFRHLLIRDAAYDGLPKAARARLHEQFADWLETNVDDVTELDELAGWHLEQTVRYRRELHQPVDPQLERRAAARLLAAGRRAARRSDVAAASNLLARAFELVPVIDPLRPQITLELAESILEHDPATADELLAIAEQDPHIADAAALVRFFWMTDAGVAGLTETVNRQLPALMERFNRAGDEYHLAKAHLVAAYVLWFGSRAEATAKEALVAAEHARRAGDDGLRARAISLAMGGLLLGPRHIDAAAEQVRELAAQMPDSTLIQLLAQAGPFHLARCRGELAHARAIVDEGIAASVRLGIPQHAASVALYASWVEEDAGDLEAALAQLRRSDALAHPAAAGHRSTTHAYIAVIEEARGHREASETALMRCEQLGAVDDVVNEAWTRQVRAKLALADGDHEAAEDWARAAARCAFTTDMPREQGAAWLTLAGVLAQRGRHDDAVEHGRAALDIYLKKGDQPAAARARSFLAEILVASGSDGSEIDFSSPASARVNPA